MAQQLLCNAALERHRGKRQRQIHRARGRVGYRFGDGVGSGFHLGDGAFGADNPRSQIDVMAERAVLNSFSSEGALAAAVSLLTKLSRHIGASLTYAMAQQIPLDWHSGTAAQVWLETSLTRRFSVGAGVGAFIASERTRLAVADSASDTSGILGVTAAYTISSR